MLEIIAFYYTYQQYANMAEKRQQSRVAWGILGIVVFIICAFIGIALGMLFMSGFSLENLANFDDESIGLRLLTTLFELLFGVSGSLLILHFLKKRPNNSDGQMNDILDQEF